MTYTEKKIIRTGQVKEVKKYIQFYCMTSYPQIIFYLLNTSNNELLKKKFNFLYIIQKVQWTNCFSTENAVTLHDKKLEQQMTYFIQLRFESQAEETEQDPRLECWVPQGHRILPGEAIPPAREQRWTCFCSSCLIWGCKGSRRWPKCWGSSPQWGRPAFLALVWPALAICGGSKPHDGR